MLKGVQSPYGACPEVSDAVGADEQIVLDGNIVTGFRDSLAIQRHSQSKIRGCLHALRVRVCVWCSRTGQVSAPIWMPFAGQV
jgi:hypothetical protein